MTIAEIRALLGLGDEYTDAQVAEAYAAYLQGQEAQSLLADFRIRYAEFAAVPDDTVEYWLTDADRIVTDEWSAGDQPVARMALAAHHMSAGGVGASGIDGALSKLGGVTSLKSGTFSASFSDAAARAQVAGGYGSTRYGREFLTYLRRNVGGPFLASACR